MKKILIAYLSRTGTTKKMAEFIAEGVRIAGREADVKSVTEIASSRDLTGYDAYVFGCPTYHLDIPASFASFMEMAQGARLEGKAGGAFTSRSHPSSTEGSEAAAQIFDGMGSVLKMRMTSLGPFHLEAAVVETVEGMRACQDYGKSVAETAATGD